MKPKTFAVELRRMSYVTFYVEADDPEQAELRAWEELEKHADSMSIDDASWDVESIEHLNDTAHEQELEALEAKLRGEK